MDKLRKRNRITDEEPHNGMGGWHIVWRFDNGFGASIVWGGVGTKHGYDLVVAKFDNPSDKADNGWDITWDTPITNCELRGLTEYAVNKVLRQVKALERE